MSSIFVENSGCLKHPTSKRVALNRGFTLIPTISTRLTSFLLGEDSPLKKGVIICNQSKQFAQIYTPPKFNSSLKNDGWKLEDYFPFGRVCFQELC